MSVTVPVSQFGAQAAEPEAPPIDVGYFCGACFRALDVELPKGQVMLGPCPFCVAPICLAQGRPFAPPIDLDKIPIADRIHVERQVERMRAERAQQSGIVLAKGAPR